MPSPSPASRELGDRLREVREKLGATQEEVAHTVGLDKQNYGRIERGTGNPSFSTLLLIAHSLQVEPGTLIAGITAEMLDPRTPRPTVKDWLEEKRRAERP